jgi:hypothetical protein
MSVLQAARALAARSREAGNVGRTLTTAETEALRVRLKATYPDWLVELLANVPLCGLEFGWQAYPPSADFDGVSWMEWSDAAGVFSESLDCYPGLAILPAGYVNVASCSTGSGDPYFVCVHDGDDPPLYQIVHDVSAEAELIITEGRVLVSPRLSDFFLSARVT